jgi:hypothetical protein
VRGARTYAPFAARLQLTPIFSATPWHRAPYVSCVSDVCFIWMLHVFHLDVPYVVMTIHVCCKCMFQIFHLFICMLQSVLFRCCICFSGHTHMLHASIQNVSSVLDVCCKCVYLDFAYVAQPMLQMCVVNVSPVSDVCCKSASCCNISKRRKRAHAETLPTGAAVPFARQAKGALVVSTCMCISRHGAHICMHTCTTSMWGAGVQAQ